MEKYGGNLKQVPKAKPTPIKLQVARARKAVRAGRGPTVDTGNVLARAAPPTTKERLRVQRAKAPPKYRGPSSAGILPDIGSGLVNAGKDILHLPQTVVQGGYEIGAAAAEAAVGNNKRANKLLTGIRQHDPIYLGGDALIKAATGDSKGAKHSARKALDEAHAHPGLSVLEVYGLKGTVGKGITRAQTRVTGVRPTVREPARVPNSPKAFPRSYSKDYFQRGVDKFREKQKIAQADELRGQAKTLENTDPSRHAERISELRAKATRVDPRIATPQQIKVAAARSAQAGRTVSEGNQAAVAKQVRLAIKPAKGKPSAAVSLTAQRITSGSHEDLLKYRNELASQYESLSDAGRIANRRLQNQIDKALTSEHDPAQVRAAADAYREITSPLQSKLVNEGVLPKEQAAKAKLVPYAVRNMEGVSPSAKGPARLSSLRVSGPVREGEAPLPPVVKAEKVPASEIKAHMAASGVPKPAYVSQRGGRISGSRGPLAPPKITGPTRTGRSTVAGQFDASPKVLVNTARSMQKLSDMADNYKSHLREFAHEPSRGKLTKPEADNLARELHARDGVEYVAVPDEPFKGDASLSQAVDNPDAPASLRAVSDALQKAYSGHANKSGTYSIMPKAAADELRAQAEAQGPQGPVSATLKGVSSMFRRTVLATSPTWFTGNAVEGGLRAAIAGVRPGDKALFNKAVARVAETDPRLAQELRARVAGGGHYHSADRADRGSMLDQYNTTRGHAAAEALQKLWAKPAPDLAANAWDKWTHFVFHNLSGRMESSIQSSMAGAAIRQGHLIGPRVSKLSHEAVDQAARGLLDTNEQAALGEEVAKMYGRYDGFTADTRHQIAMYTPFLAWTLNAANFVLHVLPKDHPTAVLLADAQEKATRDMRKELKLDELPNWLKGTIPISGGRKLPFTRYTPFGAFNDLGETAAGTLLPQFEGVRDMLLYGRDWKGKQLYGKDGKPIGGEERFLRALQVFGEGTVPVYRKIKDIVTKGPSTLNPFRPIGAAPSGHGRGSSAPASTPASSATGGSGIDFSNYGGAGSGIDFSGYGTTP